MCDFAGIDTPFSMQGKSLRALAEGKTVNAWRDQVVSEASIILSREDEIATGRMVRTDRFKYIAYSLGRHREQLFDLDKDAGELSDLSENPEYKFVLAEHRKRLMNWIFEMNDSFNFIDPNQSKV